MAHLPLADLPAPVVLPLLVSAALRGKEPEARLERLAQRERPESPDRHRPQALGEAECQAPPQLLDKAVGVLLGVEGAQLLVRPAQEGLHRLALQVRVARPLAPEVRKKPALMWSVSTIVASKRSKPKRWK